MLHIILDAESSTDNCEFKIEVLHIFHKFSHHVFIKKIAFFSCDNAQKNFYNNEK